MLSFIIVVLLDCCAFAALQNGIDARKVTIYNREARKIHYLVSVP